VHARAALDNEKAQMEGLLCRNEFDIEVRMKLSCASSYAIHAVLYLATRRSGSLVGSREIALVLGITENRLVRVLKSLVAAGILWSLRGPGGGYRLARPLAQISLLDVIEGVEGPVHGAVASLARPGQETIQHRLEMICQQLAQGNRGILAKLSLGDLLAGSDLGLRALPPHGPAQDRSLLPPEMAEGLERIRKLMAAQINGPDHANPL
jgi:Rrf2 family protein